MGFSTTQKASHVLDALLTILQQRNPAHETASNVWHTRQGEVYMQEVDREEQDDGGIVGDVHRGNGLGSVIFIGKYHIDGDGVIHSFPGATPAQQNEAMDLVKLGKYKPSGKARI